MRAPVSPVFIRGATQPQDFSRPVPSMTPPRHGYGRRATCEVQPDTNATDAGMMGTLRIRPTDPCPYLTMCMPEQALPGDSALLEGLLRFSAVSQRQPQPHLQPAALAVAREDLLVFLRVPPKPLYSGPAEIVSVLGGAG